MNDYRRRLLAAACAGAGLAAVPRGAPAAAAEATLAPVAPATQAPVAESAVLTVALFPLLDEIVQAALPAWRRLQPNVELRIVSRQYADHHTAMTTALSTARGLPDVMALESTVVGRFAQGSGLEDLARPPYQVARFRDRWVPFAYDQALAREGGVVAVPTDVGPGTMLYRPDILQQAGVDALSLSVSWESYLAAGRQVKQRTGAFLIADVHEIKDILLRTGIRPGEGMYFDRDSNVLVRTPRFVRAFEVALEGRRAGLDAKVKAWSNDWAEGFRRGRLATELGGAWLVGQMSNWIAPQTAGLWRAAQLPEGANAGYGGSFYAMPRRADPSRKLLAWQLIQLLTLDPVQQLSAFRSHDAFPALLATHETPFFDEPVAFLGGQPARQLWRVAARRIAGSPVHKQQAFADEVIGTELDNVLVRGKTIAAALADAERLLQRRARR